MSRLWRMVAEGHLQIIVLAKPRCGYAIHPDDANRYNMAYIKQYNYTMFGLLLAEDESLLLQESLTELPYVADSNSAAGEDYYRVMPDVPWLESLP